MGAESFGYTIGKMKTGKRNRITDVPGVKVGHVTLADHEVQTGVTAIIPGEGSTFRNKFPAAVHVINGFGKSIGLIQVQELGTLETPILLTNTFSVAACAEGLLTYMLADHPEIGVTTGTVNPVVCECNDSGLNDIRARSITQEHALAAIASAAETFEEGAVGAGRGMSCYGWKGGIGSASRIVPICGNDYTVGALLLTNFGSKQDLTICGEKICERSGEKQRDQGSCIMILATDIPMTERQLLRCTHRAQNGLARTGTITGGGSGDIVLMFSTANRIPHGAERLLHGEFIGEDCLDEVFRAVAETVEESVISELLHAETVTGVRGKTVVALRDSGLL